MRTSIVLILILLVLMSGCVSIGGGLNRTAWSSSVIPAPQPGLVLPINRSPGVWADCYLFTGKFRREDLMRPYQEGMAFVKSPLKQFTINPPLARIASTAITYPLMLNPYDADYTLLVFYKNFRGWLVRIDTIRFSVDGDPFDSHWHSGGRRIYADKVIKLSRVKPYPSRKIKFRMVLYPGHALLR